MKDSFMRHFAITLALFCTSLQAQSYHFPSPGLFVKDENMPITPVRSTSPDGTMRVMRDEAGNVLLQIGRGVQAINLGAKSITPPIFSPEGKRLYFTDGNSLHVYHITTKRLRSKRFVDFIAEHRVAGTLYPPTVTKLQLSPDGKALLMYVPRQPLGDLYVFYFAQRRVLYLTGYKPVITATFDGNNRIIANSRAGYEVYDLTMIAPRAIDAPLQPVTPPDNGSITPPPPGSPVRKRRRTYPDPAEVFKAPTK